MRWLIVVALAACGRSGTPPIANTAPAARSLYPVKIGECTTDGWCRFADPPPIYASGLWVGRTALFVGGYIPGKSDHGPDDEESGAVARWDGTTWKVWKLGGAAFLSIDGYGDRVFASGRVTTIHQLVGDEWQPDEEGGTYYDPTQIVVSTDDAFVTVNGIIQRRGPMARWDPVHSPPGNSSTDNQVYDIDADDAGGVWAIVRLKGEDTRVYSWKPGSQKFEPADIHRDIYRISARTPRDVAILGNDGVFRWDGQSWNAVPMTIDIGNSEIKHRGEELVILGSTDSDTRGVAILAGGKTTFHELPDNPDELAVGPDGGLWAASTSTNAIWFRRP